MKQILLVFGGCHLLIAVQAQSNSAPDPAVLLGSWTLDMTPADPDDDKFAKLEVEAATDNSLSGIFYREGVKIREGRINRQSATLYGAFVSGDGTGTYNTAFYYQGGKLYGSTHSLQKDFLSIWTGERAAADKFVPNFTETKKTTHKIAKDQDYTFGYLEVLENREDPTSGTIQLPVYIFKSRNPNPQPDPIIYTVGGPGATTMRSAQYMRYYQYLDDRDFILVEQRGNYYAKPSLECPEWADALYLAGLPDCEEHVADSLFRAAAQSCRDRLTGEGIDLNSYHTTAIAADIADLVEVLDIEEYNLLTISYSTKIAQVLLRDYPTGIRSVVMDSPLPLEVNYDEESVNNLLRILENLLDDCAADPDCNTAYPNLKERFRAYLREKTKAPLVVTVPHPTTEEATTFYLKGEDLIAVFSTASTGSIPAVPREIAKLLDNDLSSVTARLSSLLQKRSSSFAMGMRLSVWCAEEYPFVDQEVIEQETKRYPEVTGLSPTVFDSSVCNIWRVKSRGAIENEPVKSDIPVLLISGDYDFETPPWWARQMQENLSNSYHLVFKGWTHGPTTNWSNPCGMEVANAFFNNPSEVPLLKCFEEIETPKFGVD